MSRYIDADALTKEIKQDIADNGLTERYVFYRINNAPSIDIVFCKECKFWIGHISDDDGFDEGLDECRWRDSEAPDADDFCSYGEPNCSEIPNNSTISKMEQVDKDINVRSKDEPQNCDDCIWSVCNYNKAFEDEPQTEREGE